MLSLRAGPAFAIEPLRPERLAEVPNTFGSLPMQDLIWLAVLAGLALLTFAYVRLCDAA